MKALICSVALGAALVACGGEETSTRRVASLSTTPSTGTEETGRSATSAPSVPTDPNEAILKYLQLRLQSAITHERWGDMLHGSLLKNAFTRALAHRTTLAVDLEGAEGMLWDDAEGNGFWQYQCLNQFAARIGGGTEEVHRNNLSEQALGLPREQRSDLDVPWSQTTRS